MRLLSVKDDPMVGSGVCQGLTPNGCAVDWVRDVVAADLASESNDFEVMPLDLGLLQKPGFHASDCMRRRKKQIAAFGRKTLLLTICTIMCIAAHPVIAAPYVSLVIVSPENNATIHDNMGRIDIDAKLSPALQTGDGDRLVAILDDAPIQRSRDHRITLKDVPRGTHTIRLKVVDPSGRDLIVSEPRTVYIWRASVLFHNRNGH